LNLLVDRPRTHIFKMGDLIGREVLKYVPQIFPLAFGQPRETGFVELRFIILAHQ